MIITHRSRERKFVQDVSLHSMATPGPEVPPNYVIEKSDWHSDIMIRTRRTGVDPFTLCPCWVLVPYGYIWLKLRVNESHVYPYHKRLGWSYYDHKFCQVWYTARFGIINTVAVKCLGSAVPILFMEHSGDIFCSFHNLKLMPNPNLRFWLDALHLKENNIIRLRRSIYYREFVNEAQRSGAWSLKCKLKLRCKRGLAIRVRIGKIEFQSDSGNKLHRRSLDHVSSFPDL